MKIWRFGLIMLGLTALCGCAADNSQHARELAACRAQADATDNRINRADMIHTDDAAAPLAGAGMPGFNPHPLIEQEVHDKNVSDCMAGTGP